MMGNISTIRGASAICTKNRGTVGKQKGLWVNRDDCGCSLAPLLMVGCCGVEYDGKCGLWIIHYPVGQQFLICFKERRTLCYYEIKTSPPLSAKSHAATEHVNTAILPVHTWKCSCSSGCHITMSVVVILKLVCMMMLSSLDITFCHFIWFQAQF